MSPRTAAVWPAPCSWSLAGSSRCDQIHGTGIAKVGWEDAGSVLAASDGLVTDQIGLPPLTIVCRADCVRLLLLRPGAACGSAWCARPRLAQQPSTAAATALLWTLQAAYASDPAQISNT
jgi:hypothetical protein